jgi:orotidine-5'-phosphate decarboxylase
VRPHERIFVALDTPDPSRAIELARRLSGRVGGMKIGLQLFSSAGPDVVHRVIDVGMDVFVDLKLHDIPNTVAGAAAAVTRLGASFFTVHALGGEAMIRRAVESSAEAASSAGRPEPTVLAVTILTSHADEDLDRIGVGGPCSTAVERLAGVARGGRAGGIVCSPLEIERVRRIFPEATLVVPGIRPGGKRQGATDDQQRIATPGRAVEAGADRLVIGRPITGADDPVAAAEAIASEIPV